MSSGVPNLSDEYRHAPSRHETWWFDAAGPDWAIHCALALLDARTASWWTVFARREEPLLLVRDDTLEGPRANSFEVRGSGLWADIHCHEPMQRWQVNFEGIALALDDLAAVGHRELGDLVPVEFEFEWEAAAPPTDHGAGYVQPCVVDGEMQIGTGQGFALDAAVLGRRGHTW